MAAGEQARARTELFQQRDGVLDARGPLVVKRRWNLQGDPFGDAPPGQLRALPVVLLGAYLAAGRVAASSTLKRSLRTEYVR
jgi:hypothetical protein